MDYLQFSPFPAADRESPRSKQGQEECSKMTSDLRRIACPSLEVGVGREKKAARQGRKESSKSTNEQSNAPFVSVVVSLTISTPIFTTELFLSSHSREKQSEEKNVFRRNKNNHSRASLASMHKRR
jgi:hypothetical protein